VKERNQNNISPSNKGKIEIFQFLRNHKFRHMSQQQQNILLSESIISGRLSNNTKLQYRGKQAALAAWLKANEPTHLNENTEVIILPLNDEVVTAFFGHICRKRKRNSSEYIEPTKYLSLSHVGNYKSSIKDVYKQRNVTMPASTEKIVSEFMAGYTRKVATMKQEAEMSLVEVIFPFLLAPLAYHSYYLTRTLPQDHPCFSITCLGFWAR